MQPATSNLGGPDGRSVPYRRATPGQHAQAVRWLAHQLHDRFPTLSVTGWSQAFHRLQPELWEDRNGITLNHQDLARFAQRLADSSLVPDPDPDPLLCCDDARYLAELFAYMSRVASDLRPELEVSPLARNLQLMALIERLEIGNAVAERVLRMTH
ncbi:MAG: hypothetical protein M3Y54_03170 [Bacteroidota bacterium]|nr:hypothetical protein [Bacteroidota bacterium]